MLAISLWPDTLERSCVALKSLLRAPHKRGAKKLYPTIHDIYEGSPSLSDDEVEAETTEFEADIKKQTAEPEQGRAQLQDGKRHLEYAWLTHSSGSVENSSPSCLEEAE